nr:hypothetical protein BSM_06870 [uncultured archaeon]
MHSTQIKANRVIRSVKEQNRFFNFFSVDKTKES